MRVVSKQDLRAIVLLFVVFSLLYGYFFQGGGWNPNSHFDTVRAIVERHAVDITPVAANTGDIAIHDGKTYSNKGPGLALWVAPIYFVLYHLERKFGAATEHYSKVNLNAQILTFFASGLPGVILVLLLFLHFRRQNATIGESLCLAGGFGAGSLIFPYAGVMMSHVFTACILFGTWQIISHRSANRVHIAVAGLMAGMAVVVDSLSVAAAVIFLFYVVWRRSWQELLGFSAGAGVMAALFLTYNKLTFGSVFTSNQTLEGGFQTKGLLFGMLQVPDFERLYWLTVHPFRGLFYCCPVMLLALLSLPRRWRFRAVPLETVIPLIIIGTYLFFNLCFNGWAGGWGVGPRYLIPIFPFLFSFALRGFRLFTAPSSLLIAVSVVIMFSVSAVQLMVPAPNDRIDTRLDPVSDSVRRLSRGEVSTSTQSMLDYVPVHSSPNDLSEPAAWASYNLGEVMGLHGLQSVVPAAALLFALAVMTLAFYWQRE
jgi:hypothetical protein